MATQKVIAEKTIEDEIKAELTRMKAFWFKHHASEYTPPGIPDLVTCINGTFVGIEVKASNKLKNTSLAQDTQIMLIKRAGGVAFVCNSLDMFKEKLKEFGVI